MHKFELMWRSVLATFTMPGVCLVWIALFAFALLLRRLSRNPEANPRKIRRFQHLLLGLLVVFTCVCAAISGRNAVILNTAVVNSKAYHRMRMLCAHPVIPLELKRKLGNCERWNFGIPDNLYGAKEVLREECKRPGVRERARDWCNEVDDSRQAIEFHSFRSFCADPRFTLEAQESAHFPRCRALGLRVPFSPEERAAIIREECLTLAGQAHFGALCPPFDLSALDQ